MEWISPDFEAIPEILRNFDAWVVWKAEPNGESKARKIPYSPMTGTRVSPSDPRSGCPFEEARRAYLAGGYTGLGIIMDSAPGLVGVDLDRCVGPGRVIDSREEEMLQSLASYAEYSPSGTGLRVFGLGTLPSGRRRKGNVEMYDGGRFLTVTGVAYLDPVIEAPYPVREFQKALSSLHSQELGSGGEISSMAHLDALRGTSRRMDDEVLKIAQAASNGDKFSRLYYEGDLTGYDSQSEADLALCGMLAFYTGGDPDQIERLFGASALSREKWTNRRDYRDSTISKALSGNEASFGSHTPPEDDFDDLPPDIGTMAGEVGDVQDFPLDALPAVVAGFVRDNSERMGCPPEFIAIPALVTLAGCIGREPRIAPKRYDTGWKERACLYGVVVAQKGSMKSPAQRAALGPLYRIQKKYWKRYLREKSEWEEAERERKVLQKQKGAGSKDDAKSFEINDEIPKPIAVRPLVDDITVEAVVRLMPDNPRLTLAADELSGFFKNMGRYNRGDDRGFWLQAHTPGPVINDRKGSGTVFVEDSYVNIVGGIQPRVLKDLFFSRGGVDDGLLERFGLLAYPPKSIVRGQDRKPNSEIRDEYYWVCEKLFEVNWCELLGTRGSDIEDGYCSLIRFDEEAQGEFDQWFASHMERLAEMPESSLVGFFSKARGLLCRLALVLHLVRWASGEQLDPRYVSLNTLAGAILLVDGYFASMWGRAVHGGQSDWVADLFSRLRAHLRKNGEEKFTRRDLVRLNWKGLGNAATVDSFINRLLVKGLVREESRFSGSKGGRPTVHYCMS